MTKPQLLSRGSFRGTLFWRRGKAECMGFLGIFNSHDINHYVDVFRSTEGAVLLDVRTPGEYAEGHIPGSVNISLQTIDKAARVIENKNTPIFLYCRSGARSRQAADMLRHMGYEDITDMGGIARYRGKVEI